MIEVNPQKIIRSLQQEYSAGSKQHIAMNILLVRLVVETVGLNRFSLAVSLIYELKEKYER